MDLTDLDYSEELWIAAHDDDEQNASLALHVWEDNGLDVPEGYLASLLQYLGAASGMTSPLIQLSNNVIQVTTALQSALAAPARWLTLLSTFHHRLSPRSAG